MKAQAPKIVLAEAAGEEATQFVSGTTVHHTILFWAVSGRNGVLDPVVIKGAVDAKLRTKDGLLTPFFDSLGSKKNGFVNYTWRYQHKESGVKGRLTIWLTEFKAERAKLTVEIDERKDE